MNISKGSCRKVIIKENHVEKFPISKECNNHNISEIIVYNKYNEEVPYLADILEVYKENDMEIIKMEKTETFREIVIKDMDKYIEDADVYSDKPIKRLEDMTSDLTLDDEYMLCNMGFEDLYECVVDMININEELIIGLEECEITSPYNWGLSKDGYWKLFDYSTIPHYL